MSRLSVVLPACNEEPMVEKTCRTLRELLGQAGIRYELVLVDDGSSDGHLGSHRKSIQGR